MDPWLWNVNSVESYRRFDPNYTESRPESYALCSELNPMGYLDYFVINDLSNVESMDFYVDRGIANFDALAYCLNERVPKLKKVTITQNYSMSPYQDNLETYQAFLRFLNLSIMFLLFSKLNTSSIRKCSTKQLCQSIKVNSSTESKFNCDAMFDWEYEKYDKEVNFQIETRNGTTVTVYSKQLDLDDDSSVN
jgi:hypothetical protein